MDARSPINDDACKYIIENTIKECNRVLNNWVDNEKKIGYDEKVSLFRSYLAKFFKHKFGYQAYNRYIRSYHPLVTINGKMVINIDFNIPIGSIRNPNLYLVSLHNYVSKMDVLRFSELHDLRPANYIEQGPEPPFNVGCLIDYQKLNNIKFN